MAAKSHASTDRGDLRFSRSNCDSRRQVNQMSSDEVAKGSRRQLRGRVVSDKMDKTIVVAVERMYKHPRYRKYVSRMQTYKAHDEGNECRVDDTVIIEESRPLSRTKRWMVIERIPATNTGGAA
jgi:small subunit ribosomal protein S17